MKTNFTIKPVSKKVQLSSAKQETNNVLNFVKDAVCCDWAVTIVGNANVQKSLVLR